MLGRFKTFFREIYQSTNPHAGQRLLIPKLLVPIFPRDWHPLLPASPPSAAEGIGGTCSLNLFRTYFPARICDMCNLHDIRLPSAQSGSLLLSVDLPDHPQSVGLMSAIPFDSAVIFCRDTIMYAAADEDDDNKLESTTDITNRDRSE